MRLIYKQAANKMNVCTQQKFALIFQWRHSGCFVFAVGGHGFSFRMQRQLPHASILVCGNLLRWTLRMFDSLVNFLKHLRLDPLHT